MKNYLIAFALLIICGAATAQTLAAKTILSAAYQQARAENKNVMVIFHASWCGWCNKMDSSLNNPLCKKYFTDNYIITHLTVYESKDKKHLENAGADELLKQYKAFDKGIPFWLVFDKDGNFLADGFMKNDDGTQSLIGCPASEKEVAAFIEVLRKTSSLNEQELAVISGIFRKNE